MPKRARSKPKLVTYPWHIVKLGIGCTMLLGVVLAAFLDRAQDPLMASATPNTPIAPIHAVLAAPWGAGLPDGAWASTPNLTFRVTLAGNADLRTVVPEFEVLPAAVHFSGRPNTAGPLVTLAAGRRAIVTLPVGSLANNRRYHWRVRARGMDGTTSAWVGGSTFGISLAPPSAPVLISANAPASQPTNIRTISLHWSASTDRTGVTFYQWATSHDALAVPTWHRATGRELHLRDLNDGTWYISVRAVNGAGIPSASLRYAVEIDRTAAHIGDLASVSNAVSVGGAPMHLHFSLSQSATTNLIVAGTDGLRASARLSLGVLPAGSEDVTWDGTDGQGHYVPTGSYTLMVSTADMLGNTDQASLPVTVNVDSRRVVVSLSKQQMTVYDGTTVLRHGLITSGGPETQTPVGTFHILAKYSPYVMRSPWPKSSRLWYPDSPVTYAILFKEGGYFFHDAPWRSVYGPGTNAVDGIPGGNTTGTHGCVNVPLADEAWLYAWAGLGTVVQILP